MPRAADEGPPRDDHRVEPGLSDRRSAATPSSVLSIDGRRPEIAEEFHGPELDRRLWFPYYLPHWSGRDPAAARYSFHGGALSLEIRADQPPWCPEFDGWLRVSSLQTGSYSGPIGSDLGQHHFHERLRVREAQPASALYTPRYGLFELRARAEIDANNMVAFWMIGYEDRPERSAEICICEIFGRDVRPDGVAIGMGLHPFGDPGIRDDFTREAVTIDVRDAHEYASEWAPEYVAFYVDRRLVRTVRQSPAYPMQFMIGIYEFADGERLRSAPARYPKRLILESFRAYGRVE